MHSFKVAKVIKPSVASLRRVLLFGTSSFRSKSSQAQIGIMEALSLLLSLPDPSPNTEPSQLLQVDGEVIAIINQVEILKNNTQHFFPRVH
jgi:hypothetical protein